MRTTVLPGLKAVAYYAPTTLAGMALAVQCSRLLSLTERTASAEQWTSEALAGLPAITPGLAQFITDSLLMGLGLGVILVTASRIKKARKKKDFAIQQGNHGHTGGDVPWALAVAGMLVGLVGKAVAATLAGVFFLASYSFIPALYAWVCSLLMAGLNAVHPTLAEVASYTLIKIVLSLIVIQVCSWLYSQFVHCKHPPIQTRFKIDGYMLPTRKLHPIALMARKSALVLYSQSDRTRGLHGSSVPVARITARPFANAQTSEHYILIRSDLQPQKVRRSLTAADVELVKDYLRNYMGQESPDTPISPRELTQRARESGIYKEAFAGKLAHDKQKLTPADVGRILREMSESTAEDALTAPTDEIVATLGAHDRYSHGGRFFASVFDGNPLTPTVMLKENIGQTVSCSRDPKQGYGPDYVKKRQLLMVLQHRRFQSGTSADESVDDWEDDLGDDDYGDESSTPVNIIKEDRKAWNQMLRSGLGEAYIIRMGDRQFIYDGWWFGSGEVFISWIPGLRGKRLAPRRIGYVTDEKHRIVAKLADVGWKAPTKLMGNYDRIVDVYDSRLANDKNFGLTLALLSQFMTHQRLYRENRLQQILPTSGPPAGADDDVAI